MVYPNRPSLPSTPPKVILLNNSLPEHTPLLQWIETHNPALLAPPFTEFSQPPLAEPAYRPSFQTVLTQPATPPSDPTASEPPPIFNPRSILSSRTPPPAPTQPNGPLHPTALLLPTLLQHRPPADTTPISTLTPVRPMPDPQFLLGVTGQGIVRFVFLQKSSGDDSLDEAAAGNLARLQFQPGPEPVSWGVATVQWGDPAPQGPPQKPGL